MLSKYLINPWTGWLCRTKFPQVPKGTPELTGLRNVQPGAVSEDEAKQLE